jgi:poly(3-hydroxybutyrate) depolymerase
VTTRVLLIVVFLGCGGGDPPASPDDALPGDATLDPPDAAPALCTDTTGLRAPLPACSVEQPCTRIAAELPQVPITTPTEVPSCADPRWDERLSYEHAGVPRHACLARAPGASASSLRPLIVWLHPGGEGADNAGQTQLLAKLATFDLTGDPARAGFTLVVPQGRNLRFPTVDPRDGRHHDFYFRDLGSPSQNPDISNVDALIDRLVAEGHVDPARIYVMGWSNGAFFGQLYAIARHATPTPGGSRVAAAAVFAAADPFHDVDFDPFTQQPKLSTDGSCQLASYPASAVPIQMTYRSCDGAVACGTSDAACVEPEPGYETDAWLVRAATTLPNLVGRRIGGVELGTDLDLPVDRCTAIPSCTPQAKSLCMVNHLRWPDGIYQNGSGVDNEPTMLGFLRDHPLAGS